MSEVGPVPRLVPRSLGEAGSPKGEVGFTLVELLITTTIIALLSTTGLASYSYVRMKARDTKRVSDINAIRSAIEVYFETHSTYPLAGPEGLVLGSENAAVVSDAGITSRAREKGNIYLLVPFNVLPGGVPYVYRAKYKDGSLCSQDCPSFEVSFALESPTGELPAGPHLITDNGFVGEETGASGVSKYDGIFKYVPGPDEVAAAFGSAKEVADLARTYAGRKEIQSVNAAVVAPVSVVSIAVSLIAALASALPIANAGQLLLLIFTQPFLYFSKRKRQGWGVVYNAATKVPIDLATVRLIDTTTLRAVATKVTDKDGRFAFTPKAGTYRLESLKPGFLFPSLSLQNVSDDGKFTDVYHGNLIHVATDGETLTLNVPMDFKDEPMMEAREILSVANKKALRKALAMAGPFLGAISLAVSPSVPMLLLFLLQLFLYQLFKRLAEPPAPKSQGTIYDIDTRKPIGQAVVRAYSLPYHKVLESHLTGAQGRYSFNVGPGMYYLTATKPGYEKTETEPIDFTKIDKPAWIASDLPMRKAIVKKLESVEKAEPSQSPEGKA